MYRVRTHVGGSFEFLKNPAGSGSLNISESKESSVPVLRLFKQCENSGYIPNPII